MQRGSCIGLQQQLCSEAAGASLHRSGHRAQQLDAVEPELAQKLFGLAAGLIKEVFSLGGDVSGLVPAAVERYMAEKSGAVRG